MVRIASMLFIGLAFVVLPLNSGKFASVEVLPAEGQTQALEVHHEPPLRVAFLHVPPRVTHVILDPPIVQPGDKVKVIALLNGPANTAGTAVISIPRQSGPFPYNGREKGFWKGAKKVTFAGLKVPCYYSIGGRGARDWQVTLAIRLRYRQSGALAPSISSLARGVRLAGGGQGLNGGGAGQKRAFGMLIRS